ncbi:MAG: LysR family transcriptional regulator [Hyphomicrobiaceae bacterium]|nr:LysR family transcriptional regulator [Hyphomicrobiaceae bacterium]
MNLSQLRYFVAAAELENLSLAAARLQIAQSAVSRQIRLLEAELGVALLDRVGRGVVLTEAGRTLLDRSRSLLDDVSQIKAEIADRARLPIGRLRIGANPSFGHVLFPRLAERCWKTQPNIRLHLVTDLTMPLQDWLRRGMLDLAIIAFPERDGDFVATPLTKEGIYLISPPSLDPKLGPECTMRAVAKLPLLLPGLPNRERLGYERLAALKGHSLTCGIESDSLSVLKRLAQRGLGHMMLPYVAVAEDRMEPFWKVARVKGLSVERDIVRSPRRPMTKTMEVVFDMIVQEVALLRTARLIR